MSVKKRVRKILACPSCGPGKTRKTHSYGVYRVYITGTTLVLRCKTCSLIRKYRFIQGGTVTTEGDDEDGTEEFN